MYKKTITFETFDEKPEKIVKDFWFNLNKSELFELQMEYPGGLENALNNMIINRDTATMIKFVTDIILKSYGERSDDGISFVKSPEIAQRFKQTNAYDVLFNEMLLSDDSKAMMEFIHGVMPNDIAEAAKEITTVEQAVEAMRNNNKMAEAVATIEANEA